MPAAVLVRGGDHLVLLDPTSGQPEAVALPADLRASEASEPRGIDPASFRPLVDTLRTKGGRVAVETSLVETLSKAGMPCPTATLTELRSAREILGRHPFVADRRGFLDSARRQLANALASPEESLIALAREEERVERALTREHGAADQWVTGETGPLAEYAQRWSALRATLATYLDRLDEQLEVAARACAPNLTHLLGARVAGRLVAAAGGLAPLARMSGSRIQLLGTRRRPGGLRGPKYGLIVRAVQAVQLPLGREGAFARSLASIAAIAARADAITGADVSRTLIERRDRRAAALARGAHR